MYNIHVKYINREREKDLTAFLDDCQDHKNVMMIEGARQVGKTSLADEVLKNRSERVARLNLEIEPLDLKRIDRCNDFNDFNDFIEDRFNIASGDKFILYIDEAQESRMLGSFVRSMKEQWRSASVILTGSSMTRLFRDNVRYPVGRISKIVLRPFSFLEFMNAAGKTLPAAKLEDPESISPERHVVLMEYCNLYFTFGGMPAVLSARFDQKRDLREDLLADIESDFIRLFGENQLDMVVKCMRAVANLTGSPFKNTSITGNSLSTVQNERVNSILKRLEDWHLIIRSEQNGPAPEKGYYPKRYFFDMGLLKIIRESSFPDLDIIRTIDEGSRTALGGVIENYTAVELSACGFSYSGWKKSSSGTEIDFIIKSNGRAYPVECKAAMKISSKNLAGLKNYFRYNDADIGFIVSAAPFQEFHIDGGKKIYNIPLYSIRSISGYLN